MARRARESSSGRFFLAAASTSLRGVIPVLLPTVRRISTFIRSSQRLQGRSINKVSLIQKDKP